MADLSKLRGLLAEHKEAVNNEDDGEAEEIGNKIIDEARKVAAQADAHEPNPSTTSNETAMFAQINFVRTRSNAVKPIQGTVGAAGFDLTSADVHLEGNIYVVNTGLTTSFSRDFVMLVYPRSGLARRLGLHLVNGVGVIDSDYRGEIKLMFRSSELDVSTKEILQALHPGSRVAQALITPMPIVAWNEVNNLDESVRGTGGFGSTGHN